MGYYEIIVESQLDRKRIKDFEGLEYMHLPEGRTLLYGGLKDQAELFCILNKIRDMNLTLVSMIRDFTREEEK
jgi:hypothetical protein